MHLIPHIDLYGGIDRGVNTDLDDNNQSIAAEVGFGLNLLDGNLTVLELSAIHALRGDLVAFDPSNLGGGKTTYLEVTGGVTIKPPMPKSITGFADSIGQSVVLTIRPEVRYDRALTTNTKPFDQLTNRDQWTFGIDVILQF